jgi:hypothetical protein
MATSKKQSFLKKNGIWLALATATALGFAYYKKQVALPVIPLIEVDTKTAWIDWFLSKIDRNGTKSGASWWFGIAKGNPDNEGRAWVAPKGAEYYKKFMEWATTNNIQLV